MEWIISKIPVPEGKRCRVAHFDVAGSGKAADDETVNDLEVCEGELGAVLWREAVDVFVPFLFERLSLAKFGDISRKVKRALCLGEGPGATGLALAGCGLFRKVVISDLPSLFPLLHHNVGLNPHLQKICQPMALDWLDGKALKRQLKRGGFDTIVGCEVLYGNRHTWPGLKRVIDYALNSKGEAFFCVELRNQRRDVDDFLALMAQKESDDEHDHGMFEKSGEWSMNDGELVIFSIHRVTAV